MHLVEPKHGKDHFTQILVVQNSAQNMDKLGHLFLYTDWDTPLGW